MINLYLTTTMDQAELESLNNWAREHGVEAFYADINDGAKEMVAKYNLNSFPVLIDIGHTDDSPDEMVCVQLAVGAAAIVARN